MMTGMRSSRGLAGGVFTAIMLAALPGGHAIGAEGNAEKKPPVAGGAAAPAALADRFPANKWVKLNLKIQLRPDMEFTSQMYGGTKGFSTAASYNGAAYRSRTGEALFITYWYGKLKGEPGGCQFAPGIYQNCLIGVDPVLQTMRQIDVFRWRRGGDTVGRNVVKGWVDHPPGNTHLSPTPRHPYRCLTYAPTTDMAYLYRGVYNSGDCPPDILWGYSFDKDQWTKVLDGTDGSGVTPPKGGVVDLAMAWHPSQEKDHPGYLLFFDGPPYKIDLKTLKWVRLSAKCWSGTNTGRAVDTKRNIVWFCGSAGEDKKPRTAIWAFDVDADKAVTLTSKTELWPSGRAQPGLAYLPKEDMLYLLGGSKDDNDQWVYDYKSEQWIRLPAAPFGGPSGYLEYDSKNDLAIFCTGGAGYMQHEAWYAMRFVPGEIEALKALTGGQPQTTKE